MARDLNALFQDLQNSREVYVTQDGRVERADEAHENGLREEAREGEPRPRTQLKPEIFGGRVPLTIFDGFFVLAHQMAAKFPGETGAIGMGPDPFTITELIPSGPGAKRSSASFQLDPEYLQPRLQEAESRGLMFNCVWHSHPEGCPSPSGVDRDAARSMLSDPDWGLEGHLYLPISVRHKGGFETRFFVAEGKEARIRQISPLVVSCSLPTPAASAASVTRTEEDREALRVWGWSVSLRESGNGQAWRVERDGVVLWLRLPPEYPASAPDVLVENAGRIERLSVRETPEALGWSSLRSIATLAGQAYKAVSDGRRAESLVLRPRLIHAVHRVLSRPTTSGRA